MVWFSLNYGSIDNVLTQLLTVSVHHHRQAGRPAWVDTKPHFNLVCTLSCFLSAS